MANTSDSLYLYLSLSHTYDGSS